MEVLWNVEAALYDQYKFYPAGAADSLVQESSKAGIGSKEF
jgi:hypothetical protein